MFSHITVGVSDLARASVFYDAILAPLGLRQRQVTPDGGPASLCWVVPGATLPRFYAYAPFDGKPCSAGNGSMVAFLAPDEQAVRHAHALGLAAGGVDEGAPGPRPHYGNGYYGAYLRDPDGNKIHLVYRGDYRPGRRDVNYRQGESLMPMAPEHLYQLLLVYATYLIATASPGPSNMAIMGVAMSLGRASALALALGVTTGSLFWAVLAATGVSAILASYAEALFIIKVAGGLYLLYLACKAARSALAPRRPAPEAGGATANAWQLYRRGVLLHLTNPKAVLAWIAIMSLGLRADSPSYTFPAIVMGCAVLGLFVFGGYAVVFSTPLMVRAYQRSRRWIEGILSAAFAYAGIRLLLSKT